MGKLIDVKRFARWLKRVLAAPNQSIDDVRAGLEQAQDMLNRAGTVWGMDKVAKAQKIVTQLQGAVLLLDSLDE